MRVEEVDYVQYKKNIDDVLRRVPLQKFSDIVDGPQHTVLLLPSPLTGLMQKCLELEGRGKLKRVLRSPGIRVEDTWKIPGI